VNVRSHRNGRARRLTRSEAPSDPSGGSVVHVERIRVRDGGVEPQSGAESNVRAFPAERPVGLRRRPSIAIAVADVAFHQEVLDVLERDSRIDVAGAAMMAGKAAEILRAARPDALVVCPVLTEALRHPTTRLRLPRVLVVAQEMTVPVLREAIEIGAHAVYSWPDERDELLEGAAGAPTAQPERGGRRAKVIAILGARGGAGVTFLASNLAAALADRDRQVAIVDLDPSFGELALALGVAE
jgi:DNA-binding NarL/FixJ family response regulator